MKRLRVALCFAALAALSLQAAIQEPVKVEGGLVSGTPGWAWGVRAYLGIPFAAPPVGNRRWRPPQPVIPWQGVRAAREFSPACMQLEVNWTDEQLSDPGLWHKSEDCLYLNVWTPAASAGERLPVLVWIHAGAGTMGSTARPIYDGNALAKKGVVVVSLNYRLGVFGWFAHPELTRESEHHSSGNYGALDQVAALPVGEEKHRAVRRRPRQGHDVRAVDGMRQRQLAGGFPIGQGPSQGSRSLSLSTAFTRR